MMGRSCCKLGVTKSSSIVMALHTRSKRGLKVVLMCLVIVFMVSLLRRVPV